MVAKSGDRLLQESAVGALRRRLLPLATVVTPNIPEAEVLAGRMIVSEEDARGAAMAIAELGPRYVIVKGGHRSGDPIDLVYDGQTFVPFAGERVETRNDHGTGDTFSAAIAAYLAHGLDVLEAIVAAKRYLTGALRASYAIGEGHSPVNHFHAVRLPAATTGE
jgi:hydroxymethylpyrimidine/phosphomethylpyrimidine kinase